MFETEWEFEDEFEAECEAEGECESENEWEGEDEGEEFLGALGNFARRQWGALNTPGSWQRNLALRAARAAASRLPALGAAAAGAASRAFGIPVSAATGQRAGQWASQALGRMIPQREYEDEFEDEGEYELLLNPARRALSAGPQMAHLGLSAARAQTEAEAEAFLGALVPMAARLVPRIAPAVMRAAPQLIRGVSNVGRTLMRAPAARQLVRSVPSIVRGTVGNLAQQAAQGRPVTPRAAVQTLARQTYRTLSSPARTRAAIQQTRALDRRYHQQTGTGGPGGRCTCQ
jgi:hypothetical protein